MAGSLTSSSSPTTSTKKRNRMWNSSCSAKKSKRKSQNSGSSSSSSAGGGAISDTAAENMFVEIADMDDPTVAGMDGIVKLCEQIDLDPFEDIRVLILLWKMGSKAKPGEITKDEFLSGCNRLQVDSIAKIQALIPTLDTGFLDEVDFKEFYKVRLTLMYMNDVMNGVEYTTAGMNFSKKFHEDAS
jgi:hypothetical protein